MTKLIECVPNFSEGRDLGIIKQITDAMESVEGAKLLDVDPGKATNRTVVTIAGAPEAVIESAFRGMEMAARLIDMSKHKGEHPRMGATDVCPLIPLSGISMEETAEWAIKLAAKVGSELKIPVYLYEEAQPDKSRSNLADIRAGEYEGFFKKIKEPKWKPDFGPAEMNARSGATVVGARDFLVAYNINLNTTSTRLANSIAFDVREAGRIKRSGNPYTGPVVNDENGNPVRIPGALKACKAIGWYIEEYGIAQISMNLTNTRITPVHIAFEEVVRSADSRGIRVTGSELVGLIPKQAMLDAGTYFLKKQRRSIGLPEEEIIRIAVKSLGLDELAPFDIRKKIIEYRLEDDAATRLAGLTLKLFVHETAAESPAPGGGSVAAYTGAMAAALGTMVANLSAGKRGWEEKTDYFSDWAVKGQSAIKELLTLVDKDTKAFDGVLEAMRLPKNTDEEKASRQEAIKWAMVSAIEVPLSTMRYSTALLGLLAEMIENGNPNSITDAGVGVLCNKTAVRGAYMNVMVNAKGYEGDDDIQKLVTEAKEILKANHEKADELIRKVEVSIGL